MTPEEAITLARSFAARQRLSVSGEYAHADRFDQSWGIAAPPGVGGLDDGKWYWLVYLYVPDYDPSWSWCGDYDYHFLVDPESGCVIRQPSR
jgi:hypothetical protein